MAGVPASDVDACVSGGVSTTRSAVGVLSIVGYLVDAPAAD